MTGMFKMKSRLGGGKYLTDHPTPIETYCKKMGVAYRLSYKRNRNEMYRELYVGTSNVRSVVGSLVELMDRTVVFGRGGGFSYRGENGVLVKVKGRWTKDDVACVREEYVGKMCRKYIVSSSLPRELGRYKLWISKHMLKYGTDKGKISFIKHCMGVVFIGEGEKMCSVVEDGEGKRHYFAKHLQYKP